MSATSHLRGASAALSLLAATACSHPSLVAMAQDAASAPAHSKGVGTARYYGLDGGELVSPLKAGGTPVPFAANLAQSGDGALSDRVFRLDQHGLLEGCRYVRHGRICNLATLPDGKTALGGALTWFTPDGARATPGAGGWVAQGIAVSFGVTAAELDAQLTAARASARSPFVMGSWYHCRFTGSGPRCLPVNFDGSDKVAMLAGVASFTIADGGKARDVLWVGVPDLSAFGPFAVASLHGGMSFSEIRRCETSDDADQVTCTAVAVR